MTKSECTWTSSEPMIQTRLTIGHSAVILERGATLRTSSLPEFELSADEIFNLKK
jgi:hypothetical protein